MSSAHEKLSITLPAELARLLREHVGARGVSGFAAQAIRHELERAQLAELLAELDEELGEVPENVIREARAAWRKS